MGGGAGSKVRPRRDGRLFVPWRGRRCRYDYRLVVEMWSSWVPVAEIAGALAMPDPSYVYNILSMVGAGRGRSGNNEEVCPEVVGVLSNQGVVVSGSDLHRRYYFALYACSKRGWMQRVRLKNRSVCRKVLDDGICGKVLFYVDGGALAEFLTSKLKVSRESPQTLKRLATIYLGSVLPPEVASAIRRVYKPL